MCNHLPHFTLYNPTASIGIPASQPQPQPQPQHTFTNHKHKYDKILTKQRGTTAFNI